MVYDVSGGIFYDVTITPFPRPDDLRIITRRSFVSLGHGVKSFNKTSDIVKFFYMQRAINERCYFLWIEM